jgi:hypothetical protein
VPLEVGHVQSANGGTTWSNPTDVAGPFDVTWTADTSQGRMVGDYISTSWLGGRAWTAIAVAGPPSGSVFDEDLYVPTGGLAAATGGFVNTSSGEHAVADAGGGPRVAAVGDPAPVTFSVRLPPAPNGPAGRRDHG